MMLPRIVQIHIITTSIIPFPGLKQQKKYGDGASRGVPGLTLKTVARPLASHPGWLRATASSVGHLILRLIAFLLGFLRGLILFLFPKIEIIGL